MRHVILTALDGGTATLTDESAASRYGCPVLEITAADVGGTFGPADLIGDIDKPEKRMTGAFVVAAWASLPERTAEQREFAGRFLRQWPEGPKPTTPALPQGRVFLSIGWPQSQAVPLSGDLLDCRHLPLPSIPHRSGSSAEPMGPKHGSA
jgi:hypothetical protein